MTGKTPTRRRTLPKDPAQAAHPTVTTNVAWNLAGLLATLLSQWVVIAALARYGTPSMVGQYALGLAIGAPVTLLLGMSLRTIQVTDPGSRFGHTDYLRLRIVGMAVAVGAIAAIATGLVPHAGSVVLLVGIAKAVDGIADIYFGLFQRHEQMRLASISMLINGTVSVLAVSLLLAQTRSVVWAAVGSVAGSVLGVAACWVAARPWRATRRRRPRGRGDGGSPSSRAQTWRLAPLAKIALPLGLASGLNALTGSLPRYFVEYQWGAATLGIFAALGYVVLAANLVSLSIGQVLLPRMTRHHVNGETGALVSLTTRLVLGSLLLGLLAVLLVAATGGPALALIYGAPYARQADVLTVLTIAAALGGAGSFVGAALSAVRRFGNHLTAGGATMTLTALAAYLLVPRYGIEGAAWTVVATAVSNGVLKTLMLRRALERSWN